MAPETPTKVPQPQGCLYAILAVLVVFSALCSVFVGVITGFEARQEHVRQTWPEATAHVDSCGVKQGSFKAHRSLYLHCRLLYSAGGETNAIYAYSASFPLPEAAQYPANQGQPFYDWLNAHPPGTPIAVRYNPADRSTGVIASEYMPRGGPRTPNNLKLLAVCAGSFVVLVALARIARPRLPANS